MLSFVWAEADNHGIGLNGQLPWHLPADLHHFKAKTLNHPVLMGRKTFDSLPFLLPKRHHLVLSANPDFFRKYQANDRVSVFQNREQLMTYLEKHQAELICVIGGSSLFEMLKDQVDILEKTAIHHDFSADTFMPEINYADFRLIKSEIFPATAKTPFSYEFQTYQRKKLN